MGSLFGSTLNTRYLPAGGEKFIRSDAPVNLTEAEIDWLREHRVTTVIDLREKDEYLSRPCALEGLDGFIYHHLPVTGGGSTPATPDDMRRVYAGMLDAQMDRIASIAMNAPENVLYFCSAGKDRTGAVSAVILHRLGVPDDVIAADYMATKENLMPMLEAFLSRHPEVDPAIVIPCEANIRLLLEKLRRT